jgi:hypothetical protein
MADVRWTTEVQMDALWNGPSNELKDYLQYADMPDNTVAFLKLCSKYHLQIRAWAAKKTSGPWEGNNQKPYTTRNTPSAPEASPVGTVAGYYGPASMDLSELRWRQITPEVR